MKNNCHIKIFLALLLFLLLAGCSQAPPNQTLPTEISRPVYTIDTSLVSDGVLVPKQYAQLAFNMYGITKSTVVEIGDEVQSGDSLVQLETILLEADVARAEYAVQVAQGKLNLLISQGADQEEQNIATATIDLAEADLVRARFLLNQATLVSPFDGTVVDIQIMPGEMVHPGKVIVIVADMTTFQVETLNIREIDINEIFIDQPVEVYIGALDITVSGTVSTISPRATDVGDVSTFKVTIKLDSQPQGLRWGMSAETKFLSDE